MPPVISMTLNKTESLGLYSNNDKSSQSQVNIMPKIKRDRISDPAKNKQSLPTCIIRVTSLSDHGRFTTRSQVSDTLHSRLIPHIVCNQLRPDPNNSPRLSGKYRVSSPVLFALYWQSNSSRRWYKTAITNTTTASLNP